MIREFREAQRVETAAAFQRASGTVVQADALRGREPLCQDGARERMREPKVSAALFDDDGIALAAFEALCRSHGIDVEHFGQQRQFETFA